MGEPAISNMLESMYRDGQHTAINKYLDGEITVERQKVALFRQQDSQQSATGPTHTRRPERLKFEVSKYRGVKEDSL